MARGVKVVMEQCVEENSATMRAIDSTTTTTLMATATLTSSSLAYSSILQATILHLF